MSLATLAKSLKSEGGRLLDLRERPLVEVREEQKVQRVEDVPACVQPLHQPGGEGFRVHVIGVKVLSPQGVLEEVLLFLGDALEEEVPARKLRIVLHEAHPHSFMAYYAQLPEDVGVRVNPPSHDTLQYHLCLQKLK